MRNTKICIVTAVIFCLVLTMLSAGGAESESGYGSESSISGVAPLIDDSSFFLSNTIVCRGESVEFAVDISDDNGAADVSQVMVMLSEDGNISDDDISIQLARIENVDVDATTSTFGKVWTVEGETGLKNILIGAKDTANLVATNNGVKVGTIELNPLVGFDMKDGKGGVLTTINFLGSPPGTLNVSANQNTIQINNTGGIAIDVYAYGTDFNMTGDSRTIPISNVRVDGTRMSRIPQLINHIEPGASSILNFFIDYPSAIPAGTYRGTVIFEITT